MKYNQYKSSKLIIKKKKKTSGEANEGPLSSPYEHGSIPDKGVSNSENWETGLEKWIPTISGLPGMILQSLLFAVKSMSLVKFTDLG